MAERLSDKIVRKLQSPPSGNVITYDTEVKGFGVRVTSAGARSFILNYRVSGRERRLTIGVFGTWGTAAARDESKELRRRIDRGEDPLAERIEARDAPTVKDLFIEVEKKHLPTKRVRSASDDKSMWRTYILPKLGAMKVSDVSHSDVDDLHAAISFDKPIRANRVIEVLKKGMNLAIRWGWRAENPCKGVTRNTEHKRERYLSEAEVDSLLKALANHKEKVSCNAIRLLLLTGARKSEVLGARWSMFELTPGLWTKPASLTKQDKLHRVPLSEPAIELLRTIRDQKLDDVFVFPGRAFSVPDGQPKPPSHPLTDFKHTWDSVCESAKVKDTRVNDLRHTFASVTISERHSLAIVGALLGHTQAQTTLRYAHLYDEPLRKAVNDAGAKIEGTK